MKFSFSDKQLELLYTEGKSKKLNFSTSIIKKFTERVNRISASQTVHDLSEPKSMHFKKMTGTEDLHSIRINIQYRLEFSIEFIDEKKLKANIVIHRISNHYE